MIHTSAWESLRSAMYDDSYHCMSASVSQAGMSKPHILYPALVCSSEYHTVV